MAVYAFGPFVLEVAERRLTRDGRRVAVPGKAWQILRMLAEAGGRLVSHETLRANLMQLCATYLTRKPSIRIDPVARFHLGNGARLERINWLGNTTPRGIQESFGIMVNYLYDHDSIEANHEAFVHDGTIARSADVDALLTKPD